MTSNELSDRPVPSTNHCECGPDSYIDPHAIVGYAAEELGQGAVLGARATVRRATIIYGAVEAGDDLTTGHGALIREDTTIGDEVLVGTHTVIDGRVVIGSRVSMQTNVYIPPETVIGNDVFLGPAAALTNDPYPVRQDVDLEGPTIEDHVSVGANATLLPGVTIGRGAFVAAGAIVTDDVPPHSLAIGTPATITDLPTALAGENRIGSGGVASSQ